VCDYLFKIEREKEGERGDYMCVCELREIDACRGERVMNVIKYEPR